MRSEARKLFEKSEMKVAQAVHAAARIEKAQHRFEARFVIDSDAVDMVPHLKKQLDKVLERF